MRRCLDRGGSGNGFTGIDSSAPSVRHSYPRDTGNGHKAPVSTLFEQGNDKYCILMHRQYLFQPF